MALTKVEIANSALVKIGARRIIAFTDDTKEGQLVNTRYDVCRKVVSCMHPWSCLTSRVALAPLASEPAYGFTKEFQLPADCLRVLPYDSLFDMEYRVEGRRLLCDQSIVYLTYIRDEEDVSRFDYLFSEALSLYLAQDLAYSLAESETLTERLLQQFRTFLSMAKSADAQSKPTQILSADGWLESRFRGVDSSVTENTQHADG